MIGTISRIAAIAVLLAVQAALANAAELKVFSTIGIQAALEELTPAFEKQSGNKLAVSWGTAAMLVKRVQGGETADVYILVKQSFDELTKEGKAVDGGDALFAKSGMAMVVKKGSSKPDISTSEAFKQTLLNAKTIAYSDPAAGGASGVYLAKLIERMGIADQVRNKTKHPPSGGNAANLVVSGEAELAIQQEPEVIAVAGVDLVGPLPPGLNNITSYSAGLSKATAKSESGKALVSFLHSPEAQKAFKARGLAPM
jgi:molybdate transport system substrate-binding protein